MTLPRSMALGAGVLLALWTGGSAFATPYAGEFLSTGIGARPLGMGGAFVGLVDDATAAYWNPAALPRNEGRQLVYMHSERFRDLVNYDCGALVLKPREREDGGRSAFGIGFLMVSVPGIVFNTTDPDILKYIESGADGDFDTIDTDGTQGNGQLDPGERLDLDLLNATAQEVTDRETGLFLSYGRTQVFRPELSVGASVKFVRKAVGSYAAWGMGLDVGALYELRPGWVVGLNMQDITTTFLDWSGTPSESREYISPTLKLGTAWTRELPRLRGSITAVCDVDFRFEKRKDQATVAFSIFSGDLRAGLEYLFRDTVALRVGSEEGRFTAGTGLRFRRLSFDYAFRGHADLEDTHRVSGGVAF
ncbi:MAG: hypothetical protein QF819_01495 [Gemmatimonadota bacterium]|nr:hypothetical protein [Gemmatimonadota bacterium]